MKKIFLVLIFVMLLAALAAGCSTQQTEIEATAEPVITPEPEVIDMDVPLTDEELSDVSSWEWNEEYGYYVVDNDRWEYLTVWYDPFEESYCLSHPYSSLSDEHIANGTKIYPLNKNYINVNGNTFIPFSLTELKHPDYEDDGDGVYWLLYENYNGYTFLEYCP